jgi:hypothetical protein
MLLQAEHCVESRTHDSLECFVYGGPREYLSQRIYHQPPASAAATAFLALPGWQLHPQPASAPSFGCLSSARI